jgi:hypothetical protein
MTASQVASHYQTRSNAEKERADMMEETGVPVARHCGDQQQADAGERVKRDEQDQPEQDEQGRKGDNQHAPSGAVGVECDDKKQDPSHNELHDKYRDQLRAVETLAVGECFEISEQRRA